MDIEWKYDGLEKAVVRSGLGGACVVRHGGRTARVVVPLDGSLALDGALRAR